MDPCSNWEGNKVESGDQFTSKDQLRDPGAPHTRKRLPYQSLLSELRTLAMEHGGSSIWRGSAMEHQIWTLERELRFQQMVFMFLKKFIFSNHGVWFEALNYIQAIAEMEAKPVQKAAAGLNAHKYSEADSFYFRQWNLGVSKLLETPDQTIKPDLMEFCLGIVDRLLQGNSSREYDISEFIDAILLKLKYLEISRPNMIVPVKKQIETIEEILYFVCIITRKETNLDVNLQNFLIYFRHRVNFAAALVILYWVNFKDEELLVVVSPLLEKINLSILELVEAYMVVIKPLKPSNISEIFMMRETVGRLTKVVLENLIVSTDDHFEMLKEGLMLWIDKAEDANAEDEKLICAQTSLLIDKAKSLIRLLFLDNLGEDITKRRNILLNDFLEKMDRAKAKVRQLHVEILGLSWKNIPQINRRGFLDFLSGNLQKKLNSEADIHSKT